MPLNVPRYEFPQVNVGRRPTNERLSSWVVFPHRSEQYALPVYQRSLITRPVFKADGSVGMDTTHPDPELSAMVDALLGWASQAQMQSGRVTATQQVYVQFVRLVRHLLLTNYDLSDEQIADILTMPISRLGELMGNVLVHLTSK